MINAFERYRLGWCNLITVNTSTQTISNATLTDFITTGIAYRTDIDPSTNQFFFIENHQKISRWDNCSRTENTDDKGLFVIRQDRNSSSTGAAADWMWLVPAEGRYNWEAAFWEPSWWSPGELPVFRKLAANRETGYSPTDMIPIYNPYVGQTIMYEVIFYEGAIGQLVHDPLRYGKGKDAFRLTYNEVFSPWSNPNSQRANHNSTGIGFKINSINNGVCVFDIYIGTSLNAPPSKPQNLKTSIYNGQSAKLDWEANTEPDMKWSGKYKIYRTSTSGGEPTTFYYVETINAYNVKLPVTSWIDPDPAVGTGTDKLFYRIAAVDNSNFESVPSEYDWLYWDQGMQKQNIGSDPTVTNYALEDNYPNPFNPTTAINYQIPKAGRVVLRVYDILGKEVATLVNEEKEVGRYSVNFDANKLSSGVYLYELVVNDYKNVKKLMILK